MVYAGQSEPPELYIGKIKEWIKLSIMKNETSIY